MKNINRLKIKLLGILLAFSALPLFAQPGQGQGRGQGPGPGMQMTEENVKARIERLSETLELSPEQEKKILKFELDQFNKGQAERQKFAGDREAIREYMQEQRKIRDDKYAEVLTGEQLSKYNQMLEERRQRMRESRESEGQRGRGRR